jgi:hypothetical protein
VPQALDELLHERFDPLVAPPLYVGSLMGGRARLDFGEDLLPVLLKEVCEHRTTRGTSRTSRT